MVTYILGVDMGGRSILEAQYLHEKIGGGEI
jgi:hypothetical protein